jgi:hypothetical protein
MNRIMLVIALLALAGCHSQQAPKPLDVLISEAHGFDRWNRHDTLEGDIHVAFQDGAQFDAHFIYELQTGRTRMQLADESILIYDGQNSWVFPASSTVKDARYNLRTWPFLITLPLQLHAPGSTLSPPETRKVGTTEYDAITLSFGPDAGDRANDWFTLHADKEYHHLMLLGYLITNGRPPAVVEKDAVAITFYNFRPTQGISFARDWKIWKYNRIEGIYGTPIGEARVYNLDFPILGSNTFVPPAGARMEKPLGQK